MKTKISFCLLIIVLSIPLVIGQTKKYYVSPAGCDANSGVITAPFQTINKAASLMNAGDTCFVKSGYYRENITVRESGTKNSPIVFTAYNADPVVISGTDIISNWKLYRGNIYKAYIPQRVTQVFINGQHAIKATYPNIDNFSFQKNGWARVNVGSVEGTPLTGGVVFAGTNFTENYWKGATFIGLAGKEWVMLSGNITSNKDSVLTCVSKQGPQWNNNIYSGDGVGYITNHLNAVDIANEWHWQNDTLYVCFPKGKRPAKCLIEARVRQNGFTAENRSYVNIKNINFFASTLSFQSCQYCIADGGTVRYPCPFYVHTSNWARSSANSDAWEGKGVYLSGSNNTIKNMCITNSFGDGISIGGTKNTASNCMVDSCDFAGIDVAPISMVGSSHLVEHCTIKEAGRSGLLHRKVKQATIKFNDIAYVGRLTGDLGATYTYQSNGHGSEIAYNWVHDNVSTGYSMGIYLDNADTSFVVHHNVVWNCDYAIHMNLPAVNHQLYNNTVWNCKYATKLGVGMGGHTGIVVKNNLSDKTWLNMYDIQSNNITVPTPGFTNVAENDFTLFAGSPAIDVGTQVSPFTDNFVGIAPDVGAYEFGAPKWMPGVSGITKLKFKTQSVSKKKR